MNISTLQSNLDFIKSLYFHEEWNDEQCRETILEAIQECHAKIEKAFGRSIHTLGWKKHKPSIESVAKVVKKFPSTLSHRDGRGSIPIQKAAMTRDGYGYVPILAKEGVKHKVGGEDARGGLLMINPYENRGWNTLQWFVNIGDEEQDAKRVDVLKELRQSGLFLKKDIVEQKLLAFSCWKQYKMRFEYLINWDRDALIETRVRRGNRISPLIHFLSLEPEESLLLTLKAGFKYHPQIGGLLFVNDEEGHLAFDVLCNVKGTATIMSLLYNILSPKQDYPLLHYVFTKAPQHKELFMKYFPWATQLKDHDGRSLQQAVLAAGPNLMNDHDYLFAMFTDNQIQERDPVTALYPFAAMAAGEHADLKKSFYLLRRHPSVLEKRSRAPVSGRRKKRKIEEIEDIED
ncbi:hypothetical protein CTEN210_18457 [Chaetoceros tenuissimus]|uniref:Uncharacterized protein n=1 Tax=Chaetoceros tenuissimus TaxID=426638 RepID=A0AAD3HG17_9STRA|nr:hypothetical protein CTEN210_18457 [Chaetoceros tenuissimus]